MSGIFTSVWVDWTYDFMNVRTLCLAVLSCGESTGYEIRKLATDGHFSHFVDASYGSIYPALARMEKEGLVSSREVAQSGKPTRKVYSITDTGREEFVDALGKPAQPDIFKSEFLMLAMFAQYMKPEDVQRAVDSQIRYLEEELSIISDHREKVGLMAAQWVADYGCHCIRSSLDHLIARRDELEAIAGTSLPAANVLIAAE